MKRLLMTLRGVVEAPVDAVTDLVLDVPAQPGVTVVVDRDARTVSTQGGWWYRSETTVTGHPTGSLVTVQIFDVATSMRWGVWMVARKPLRDSPGAFADQLGVLGRKLGCRAYPL